MAIKNKIKIAMKSAIRAAGFELKRLPKHRRPADRPKARAGDAKAIEYDTPLFASDQFRIEMAASCRDADNIPKVEDAGAVVIENGIPVQIMHNGVRVIAGGYPPGGWMMELIKRLRGHHEPQEEAVFHAVMKYMPSNATSLEFGGHWSYYSLWFLQGFAETRRAFVIEPDPNNLSVGRQNAAINGCPIFFTQGFVGSKSEPQFHFTTETAGSIPLPMIRIPDFLERNQIETLDLMHSDSQGVEFEVLQTCEAFLRAGKIRFVIVSTHRQIYSRDPLTHQRCLHLLRHFGGRILAEHDVHESFSGDGLIAAYFGRERIEWADVPLSYNRYSTSLFRNPLFDLSLAQAI